MQRVRVCILFHCSQFPMLVHEYCSSVAPMTFDQSLSEKAIKLYNAKTHSIKEITAITKLSQATLYRALKESKV